MKVSYKNVTRICQCEKVYEKCLLFAENKSSIFLDMRHIKLRRLSAHVCCHVHTFIYIWIPHSLARTYIYKYKH